MKSTAANDPDLIIPAGKIPTVAIPPGVYVPKSSLPHSGSPRLRAALTYPVDLLLNLLLRE